MSPLLSWLVIGALAFGAWGLARNIVRLSDQKMSEQWLRRQREARDREAR